MNYTIIGCTIAEVNELQKISIETYTDTFGEYNTEANMSAYLTEAYDLEQLTKELSNPNSFFYFLKGENNESLGYLKLNIDAAQSEEVAENSLEVERIYIRKQVKRQGFGNILIEKAIEVAKEAQKTAVWLGVWEFNLNAQKFYRKMGFEKVGAHSFIMGDDEQKDFIMLKSI